MIAFAQPRAQHDIRDAFDAAGSGFAPDPDLRCDEWSEQRRILTSEDSKITGPFRFDPIPWARDIARVLSPQVRAPRVVWKSSSQTGKTALALNFIGCAIDVSPGPVLIVTPTQSTARKFSTQRLRPMIRGCESLRAKARSGKGRDGGDSMFIKEFQGCAVFIGWAGSADELASMPIRYFLGDEVSKWSRNLDNQGDALGQGLQRTQNYGDDAKAFLESTPTEEGDCTITAEYEAGDQRKIEVPCPHCGEFQVLAWEQVQWEKTVRNGAKVHLPNTARLHCANDACGQPWTEAERLAAIQQYRWVAYRWEGIDGNYHVLSPAEAALPSAPGVVPSYESWCMYTPWETPASLAREFLKCVTDADKMRRFVNLKLGRTYKPEALELDPSDLRKRLQERFTAEVPGWVGVLTASVDVQGDRLEVMILGWGPGQELAVVHHERLRGDPDQAEVWQRLEAIITKRYTHEAGGTIRVWQVCVDSRHKPERVAWFVRPREARKAAKVAAVQGHDTRARELLSRPEKPNRFGVKPVTLATHRLKNTMLPRLQRTLPGPGYIHFCAADERVDGMDANFFEQFKSEIPKREKNSRGRWETRWKSVHERTEAIDLLVYGYAALLLLGSSVYDNLEKWQAKIVKRAQHPAEKQSKDAPTEGAAAPAPPTKAKGRPPRPPRPGGGGSWATRFGR